MDAFFFAPRKKIKEQVIDNQGKVRLWAKGNQMILTPSW
jgi:hypothetical protein